MHLDFQDEKAREALDEFHELVSSAGAEPITVIRGPRQRPDPKYFCGKGKAEEVHDAVRAAGADLVIFNHALAPTQERNLERLLECRVLDRTGLILDIFAQRAHTFEGKLQVELAQLRHLSTRLVRGWTHLERQKGGIGMRGPGETQLETDRRLIGQRIKQLNKRLEKVRQQREGRRRARRKSEVHSVSLVGYTNTGKSTLFNSLTGAETYAADQLFATLDPTLRQFDLETESDTILIDTVGFIRHLPHSLVAAFRATLEETQEADLLLHVIDVADECRHERAGEVDEVLHEVGADEVPQLLVCNKIDLLCDFEPRLDRDESGRPVRVWVSAATGVGLDLLRQAVEEHLQQQEAEQHGDSFEIGKLQRRQRYRISVAAAAGRLHAELFERGVVLAERPSDTGGWVLEVELWPRQIEQLRGELEGEVEILSTPDAGKGPLS